MHTLIAVLVASILLSPLAGTNAQTYPTKPIRFVLAFGPGTASDALARITGQELTASFGQPIVIVHKPGADGALSAQDVRRASPDGYTFLFGTNSPLAVVPNIRKEPPYDVMKDFTPITFMGDNTFFIAVHPSVPARTISELIAHARANPKALNYASPNTYALVSTALFATNNGILMNSVPYKSEPDSIPDLLSGRIQVINGTATNLAGHVRDGKLRALATTLNETCRRFPKRVSRSFRSARGSPWSALRRCRGTWSSA